MNSMSLARQLVCLLWVLAVGLSLTACGGRYFIRELPPSASPSERQAYLKSEIDRVLDTRQDVAQPGVSVMVKKDGVVVYSRSTGLARIKPATPITVDTVFEIASLAKPITAIAVLQLVERRRLSLEDSVLKWLPELPQSWNAITIHHLLSHTSGISHCCSDVPIGQIETLDGINNEQLLQRFKANDTLIFVPGSSASYSNNNYVLLAEIVSRASGIPYAQFLQENIITPLGMRSTFVYGNTPLVSSSVALNHGRDTKAFGITFAMVGPIGIFSSVSDLNALLTGLIGGKLVSARTLRTMTLPHSGAKVTDDAGDFYGYGWWVPQQQVEPYLYWHSGELDGFRTAIVVDKYKGVDLIMLSNGGKTTKITSGIIYHIVQKAYK